MSMLTVG